MSAMRPPNAPFTATTQRSPGSSKFIIAASMPAVPGAGSGMQAWSGALNSRESAALVSSMNAWNSGSRWPIVGLAKAASTRGLTSEGPGPIRIRRGGWKLCMAAISRECEPVGATFDQATRRSISVVFRPASRPRTSRR